MVAIILDEPTLLVRHHDDVGQGGGVSAATATIATATLPLSSSLTPHSAPLVDVSSSPSFKENVERNYHNQKPLQQEEPQSVKTQHHQHQHQHQHNDGKTVSFAPPSSQLNRIHEIPSCYEMTKEEKSHVYYTKQEFQCMQANVLLKVQRHVNMKPSQAILDAAGAAASSNNRRSSFSSSPDNHCFDNEYDDDDDEEEGLDFGISDLFDFLLFNDSNNDSMDHADDTSVKEVDSSFSDEDNSSNEDDESTSMRGLENFVTDIQSNERRNGIKLAVNEVLTRQCLIGSKKFMNQSDSNEQWLNTVYRPLSIAAATKARHIGIIDAQNVPPMHPTIVAMER